MVIFLKAGEGVVTLEKPTVLEVVFDDNVGDSVKHKLYIVCVGGTCEVGVNLLCVFTFVEVLKLHLDVGCCFLKCVGSWKTYRNIRKNEKKTRVRGRGVSQISFIELLIN